MTNTITNVTAPRGKSIQKHHLQLACCVSAPPINGPIILATANTTPTIPEQIGLKCNGTVKKVLITLPPKIPLLPNPAIARPTVSTMLLFAAP